MKVIVKWDDMEDEYEFDGAKIVSDIWEAIQ